LECHAMAKPALRGKRNAKIEKVTPELHI